MRKTPTTKQMKSANSKTMKSLGLVLVLSLVAVALMAGLAQARTVSAEPEKLDIDTQDFLIEKLESVLKSTPAGDSTRVPALLRLADIYAEHARLNVIREGEAGCLDHKIEKKAPVCGSAARDRKLAIERYEMALKESSGTLQSRILFQLAYLYEQHGANKQATALYNKILALGSRHFSKTILGQSEAGLGEIAFSEKRFAVARAHYEKALANTETPRKGWINYRLAWCDLNLGLPERGKQRLITVLKTPELLTLESTKGQKTDHSFQEDIARDLTVFFARTGFSENDIQTLYSLSPADARKEILIDLAEEAERLGQKRAAIAVWTVLASSKGSANSQDQSLNQRERLEAQTRVAYLRFGLGEKKQAVTDFQQTIALWKKGGCSPDAECALLEKRLRKLVIDWNKNEQNAPSTELFEMYKLFAGHFRTDAEMAFWGGNVGRELKRNAEAVGLYREAAEIAAGDLKRGTQDKNIPAVFEGSLLSEVEMAELAKDQKLRENAYTHYLSLNASGAKATEIRYQLAHLAYERGQHKVAADAFYQLASEPKVCRNADGGKGDLCRESADLALDSLVLLKEHERLEAAALEFAKKYPRSEVEYLAIARRARLNLAAQAAEGHGSAEENLKKLREMNLKGAPRGEVMLAHRNRFVLAEKTKNFDEAQSAINAQLAVPGASPAEHEDALSKKLWLAEMRLDFATAYETARKMRMPKTKPADRELRLAQLAELSGRDVRGHLNAFLKLTKNQKAALAARAKLVKLSGYTQAEFDRHYGALQANPELAASLAIEVYARQVSYQHSKAAATRLAARIQSNKRLAKTADGRHLARVRSLNALEAGLRKFAEQPALNTSSDRALTRSIQNRVKTLADADRWANQMIATGDGWFQAVSLKTVEQANLRLRSEILALPAPRGLKPQDMKRYQVLIAAKVRPFEQKAIKIDHKTRVFWADAKAIESYAQAIEESKGPRRAILEREARIFALGSPAPVAARLQKAMATEVPEIHVAKIDSAREGVKENPYSVESLRRLRDLEAQAGRETMVAYLDSRLSQMGGR